MKQKFKVVWSETAENDLIDIIEYIIRDSRSNASKIFRKTKNKANSLNISPQQGRIVPELREQGITQYRELIITHWRLMYRVAESNIYIVSVLDARQNVEDILLKRLTKADKNC